MNRVLAKDSQVSEQYEAIRDVSTLQTAWRFGTIPTSEPANYPTFNTVISAR
jgi:hypothetical protein